MWSSDKDVQGRCRLSQLTWCQKACWDTQLLHDFEQSHFRWLFLCSSLFPMLGYSECIVDWFFWVLVRGVAFYVPQVSFYCPNQGNINTRRKHDYHLGRNKTFLEGSIKASKLMCIWEGNMVKRLTEICGIAYTQINRHIALASVSPRFTFGYTAMLISPQPHHTTIPNITQRSFYPFRFKIWKAEIGMHQRCHSNSWGLSSSWGLGNCH